MASKVIGVEKWEDMVDELTFESDWICFRAVYKGAEVIADGIREAIKNIPPANVQPGHRRRGITDVEREGLLDTLGVAKHKTEGGKVYTHIGFDGYNSYVTDKYPMGHPNSMVARSLESGTSWLAKTPFIAPTVRRLRADAHSSMQQVIDEYIKDKEK